MKILILEFFNRFLYTLPFWYSIYSPVGEVICNLELTEQVPDFLNKKQQQTTQSQFFLRLT